MNWSIIKLSIYLHECSNISYERLVFFDKIYCQIVQVIRGKPQIDCKKLFENCGKVCTAPILILYFAVVF